MLSNHLKQEKKYPKQLPAPQVLNGMLSLVRRVYATASPPPWPHDIMLVAGSLARIDHAQEKRYALGVDEWRQMTGSLKDARGGNGEDQKTLCVCAPLFLFFVSYTRFF